MGSRGKVTSVAKGVVTATSVHLIDTAHRAGHSRIVAAQTCRAYTLLKLNARPSLVRQTFLLGVPCLSAHDACINECRHITPSNLAQRQCR